MNGSSSLARRLALAVSVLAAGGLFASAFSAEAGIGAVRGRVAAADSGRPLAGIRVSARPRSPLGTAEILRTRTREDGTFEFRRVSAGSYELETSTTAYQQMSYPLTVREGERSEVALNLNPGEPFLHLYVHQHNYVPDENPRVAVHGFRQGEQVRFSLAAVDPLILTRDHGSNLREMLDPVSARTPPGTFRKLQQNGIRPVRAWEHRIASRDAEGVFYDYVHLGRLAPGLYLVSARGEKTEGLGWVMVTDLAVIAKHAAGRYLVMAVNLRSGKTVPGVRIALHRSTAGPTPAPAVERTTDSRGIAAISLPGEERAALVARKGASLAFMRLYGYGGGDTRKYRVSTYTDRPVYRPGQKVHFKGVARLLAGTGYDIPSSRPVRVEVADEQGTSVFEDVLQLNDRGAFAGSFNLPAAAGSGYYTIRTSIEGEDSEEGFVIASYRKPEWRVDVKTPKRSYIRGERVPVTVDAAYYFGAPVARAKVHYWVYRSEFWRWWTEDEEEAYEEDFDGSPYGEIVAEGELATDGSGTAKFEFPTALPEEADQAFDYQYHLEVQVVDESDRVASGTGRVRVSAGELTVDARPERYVAAPGVKTPVRVRVRDLEGRPAAGVSLAATSTLRNSGSRPEDRVLLRETVVTDAGGEAVLPVASDETGLLVVRFSATDRRGNTVEGSGDVWISTAEGGDYMPAYPDLALVPDKKQYRPGEVAQVLINTGKPGATALVAVQAERVLEYRVISLAKKSTVVRLPIRPGYEPNVFVSACFIRNKEFHGSESRLNIDARAHRLNVTVESDRAVYRPRETANYRVRVTDERGRPVAAELSFGLVDESIYAILEDEKDPLWSDFYPRRYNEVQTDYSFPQIYLGDSAKDANDESLRKEFPDTAFWRPFLKTDAAGEAVVKVRLPDTLTSWRATVIAHSPDTQVGRATQNVRVTKELVLRLQAPRVFTEGDILTVSGVAHNYTGTPLDAAVELRASGLELNGSAVRKTRIGPGEAKRVEWRVRAVTPGKAVLTGIAAAGALSDALELTVPVRSFTTERVLYRTGALSGETAAEEFDLDPQAAGGDAEVRFSPTIAGTLLGALEYLATYPHGCTEQTMSSFLPDVVIHRALKGLDLRKPKLEQKLPAMVEAGLLRLYRFQGHDGGWGWWEHDSSDPWLTAYVLFGLTAARQAGFAVNERIYGNGLAAAVELSRNPELRIDEAAFLAFVLVRAGAAGKARPLLDRLERHVRGPVPPKSPLQLRSYGYWLLALAGTGSFRDRERAGGLMRELWGRAVTAGGEPHWEEPRSAYDYRLHQDVETTAVLLNAALAVTPDDPRLSGVARWLLARRNGNRWESTRDTAWILMALAEYLRRSGELRPHYRLSLLLNGKEIHRDEAGPGDALGPETVLRIPLKELAASNRLELRKEGEGTVYYTLRVLQQLRSAAFSAESTVPGLSIRREYFRAASRRDRDGRPSAAAEGKPSSRARVGERLLVRLTLRTEHPLEHLMLESPVPAGMEVLDRGEVSRDEWRYWWSHTDVRDDRVNVFIRNLPRGEHRIEFYARPEMAGTVQGLPAVISDMYSPAVRASSPDDRLEMTR